MLIGVGEKEKEDFKSGITTAFYSAYFSRLEKFSTKALDDVLEAIDKGPERDMTDEDMFEAVKRLAESFGG